MFHFDIFSHNYNLHFILTFFRFFVWVWIGFILQKKYSKIATTMTEMQKCSFIRLNAINISKTLNENLNRIQIGCCGADGSHDYITMRQPLPSTCRDTVTGNAFFHGCVDELTWLLEDKSEWVAGLAMTLSFIAVRMITVFDELEGFFLLTFFKWILSFLNVVL